MGTPLSADDLDAMRARVRSVTCLPDVESAEANGHIGFSVRGRRFAWLLVDHHGDGRLALCIKAPPGEQEALVKQGDRYFTPAYLGSKGWVGVDLAPDSGIDWDVVATLVEQGWRMCASKRLIAALENESERLPPSGDAS